MTKCGKCQEPMQHISYENRIVGMYKLDEFIMRRTLYALWRCRHCGTQTFLISKYDRVS